MKKLQIFRGGKWKYVFCYTHTMGIITTETKSKALPTDARWAKDDLAYFQNKYGRAQFRLA